VSYDNCVKIEKAVNGYTVEVQDPKVVKQNAKPGAYKDPSRCIVFTDKKALAKWLDTDLDKYLGEDEYSSSFATAVAEKD